MTPPDGLPHDPRTSAVTVAVGPSTPTPTPGPVRFAPGSVVAGRYRLIALLGRGGMGEVYRADDLTLNHPVALKFLPQAEASSGSADAGARLERLHNELRLARQVSHKNVCRLYDLGDADGRPFLTMEYVDGEDLASLLRRIGRLPHDKAIQVARQLCAGVAAAHERGVLHRDLKPANVMIDGEGNVRITDFGIATATGKAGTDVAGTPQYMAPEQLTGGEASARSDIYSLGLVLFEVFTGRRAYEAKTLGEVKQLHETMTMTTPSSIVRDLDPAVERVILRCLERDPERRPASALMVAAALPGGDPLAAALAAGETPSPDLLVAAGESEAVAVAPALTMALSFVVVLLVFAALASRASLPGLVPMDKPRDVLSDRAEQVFRTLGFQPQIADLAAGFVPSLDYLRWAERNGPADWWTSLESGRPPGLLFWMRTSPREFVPMVQGSSVTPIDPPMNTSGMHQLFLDTSGRLVEFHSVPPQLESSPGTPVPPAWRTLFEAAELDFDKFTAVPPQWTPRDFADVRIAWEGPLSGRPDLRIRVEAAAFNGRPVSFLIVGPWTQAVRMQPIARTTLQNIARGLSAGFWVVLLVGAVALARYNLKADRADRRGAARLAISMLIVELTARLLIAHHVSTPSVEANQLLGAIGFATRIGGALWVLYLAIEPYARRFWPDLLLGWTRLLSGRLHDPRVGRDILIGLTFAAARLVLELTRLLPPLLGGRAPVPPFGDAFAAIMGPSPLLARLLGSFQISVETALALAMVFVVARLVLKRSWLAILAGIFVAVVVSNNGSALAGTWTDTVVVTAMVSLLSVTVYHYGLLALVVSLFVSNVTIAIPFTLNPSVWWALPSNFTLLLFAGLACLGYYAARAGQPLFGTLLKD